MQRATDRQLAVIVEGNGLLAALIVLTVMWTLYARYSGFLALPDLRGYENMYYTGGSYLRDQGRDPLFVWLIGHAWRVFGTNGFLGFRFFLYALYAVSAAWIAYVARGPAPLSAIVILVSILLKSAEQLREGVAFLLIALPLVRLFRTRMDGARVAGIGSILASLTHWGATFLLGTWLGAAILVALPRRILGSGRLPWVLLSTGIVGGLIFASLVIDRGDLLASLLTQISGVTSSAPESRVAKYVYWSLLGTGLVFISGQLQRAAWGCSKFGYAYATLMARLFLPFAYTVPAYLVFRNFEFGPVLELFQRNLATTIGLSMIIIVLRGRANFLTAGVAVLLFANELRTVLPSLVP